MPIIRLPEGELRDEIRQPLYDTLAITNAGGPNGVDQFFAQVAGKSRAFTNLRQNNLLETAVSYRVQGMHLDGQNHYENQAKVLPLIMDYSSARVHIGEKDYWEGPFVYLAGRVEAELSTFDRNEVYQKFGAEAIQGIILMGRHVIDINPLQSFFVERTTAVPAASVGVATPAVNQDVLLKFSFKGLLRRPVQ